VIGHSLLGSRSYGAFAAKITIVRLRRFPRWVLPTAGGLLFAVLIGVWYTSAIWLYGHSTNAAPAYAAPSTIPAGANAVAGETVFKQSGCGGCHVLKAAGASGQVGPDLDKLQPGFAQVKLQVENGGGVMPSFKGKLTPAEIRDVAAYVAIWAGASALERPRRRTRPGRSSAMRFARVAPARPARPARRPRSRPAHA
jgi:mono/diheme cytochrome c family protein